MLDEFGPRNWRSLMQVEYSTDLVFRSTQTLAPLYKQLSRQTVLGVKADQVSIFLGNKLSARVQAEIGSRFSTRIVGICIKYRFGSCSVTLYDQFQRVQHIETTTNDVSFFKHHRKVEHRESPSTRELVPLKKSTYSLIDLCDVLLGHHRRYLEFLSSLDDSSRGERDLALLSGPTRNHTGRVIKGLTSSRAPSRRCSGPSSAPNSIFTGCAVAT